MVSSVKKDFLQKAFNIILCRNQRLAMAVDQDNVKNIHALLGKGADPHALNGSGRSAFIDASAQGKENIVKIFLNHKSEVEDFEDNKKKAFLQAVEHYHEKVMVEFIQTGLSKETIKEARIVTVKKGYQDILPILSSVYALEKGELDKMLIEAVKNGQGKRQRSMVLALLDEGADINATDKNGNTALIWAAARGNEEIESLLLSKDADTTIKSKEGYTATTIAAHNGYEKSVFLIDPEFPKSKIRNLSTDGPFAPSF